MMRGNLVRLFTAGTVLTLVTVAAPASDVGIAPTAQYPAVSPDGTELVFVSDLGGNRDLWIADATGVNATLLSPSPGSDQTQPSWAPDGKRIVFSSTRGAEKHNIWIIAPDGSNLRQLTFDIAEHEHPRFSPQGSSILYLSNSTGKRELRIMNSDGSGQRAVASIGSLVSDPAWSPDGQQIVYVGCDKGGPCNLFRINADGSGRFQITSGNFQDWTPDWGIPGIIFASNRGDSQGLWLVQADGSGLQQVTAPLGAADLDPRWIGSGVVFGRSGNSLADAASDIWSVSALGATPQRLTRLPPTIVTLLKSFGLPAGTQNSLDAKLQQAFASIERNQSNTACNQFAAFIHEVNAQSGQALTVDQANQLLAVANEMLVELSCRI